MNEALTTIGFESPEGIAPSLEQDVRDALAADANWPITAGDTYFGGKQLAAVGRLAVIADELNETALAAAEAGVEVGTRTTVDVLDAQQTLFGARSDLSRARYDYMLAVLELERAAGSLGPDDLLRINERLGPGEPLLESAVGEAELMRQ